MHVVKLNEFNILKTEVEEYGQQAKAWIVKTGD